MDRCTPCNVKTLSFKEQLTRLSHFIRVKLGVMLQHFDSRAKMHLDANNGLDRVTELVHTRLLESGWRDQVRLACRKLLNDQDNPNITVDELIHMVTPKARSLVPDAVKRELLHEIELIMSNIEKTGYVKDEEND